MPPDDGAAAPVAPESQQLREEPGGEETGVAPDAAVAQGRDAIRLPLPERHQGLHALPPQKRLIRHQKERPRTVPQGREPQGDAAADPGLRRVVPDGGEGELPGKVQDLRVLRHDRHRGELLRRDGGKGAADEGLPLHRGQELVAAEAAGAARRQDHAAGLMIHLHEKRPLFGISISTPAGGSQCPPVEIQRRNAL